MDKYYSELLIEDEILQTEFQDFVKFIEGKLETDSKNIEVISDLNDLGEIWLLEDLTPNFQYKLYIDDNTMTEIGSVMIGTFEGKKAVFQQNASPIGIFMRKEDWEEIVKNKNLTKKNLQDYV